MAALQTLRNKPVLLMSVIGGALLLFIITMVLENQSGSFNQTTDAGEAYGEELSMMDFNEKVNNEENMATVVNILQGNNQPLNEQQKAAIKERAWDEFLLINTVRNEADELGLEVSDKDIENALKAGNLPQVQFLMQIGGSGNIDGYKKFMKDFDKILGQIRKEAPQMEENYIRIHNACRYAESQIPDAILVDKYFSLMRHSYTTNPSNVKMMLDEYNTVASADYVAVPYTSISDSTVKVTDEELKSKYNEYKKNFYTPATARAVKFIDVRVNASNTDVAAINKEVAAIEKELVNAKTIEEVTEAMSNSKTTIAYNPVYVTKEDLPSDIAGALDTMSVGAVRPTYRDASSFTTFKFVNKVNTADSLLIQQVFAATKAQADSILNVVSNGTSTLSKVAVSLKQPDTTVWANEPYYAERPAEADSNVYTTYTQIGLNKTGIVPIQQGFLVAKVLDQKHNSTKYNVAVVKYPIEYSKETYDNALSKLHNYLANNKTVEDFKKNAAKENYYVQDYYAVSSMNYSGLNQIMGNEQAKAAARWILDEAEDGDISNAFECATSNSEAHLVAFAVTSTSDDNFLTLDNELVKEQVTALVKKDKKVAMIKEQLKNAKSLADARNVKGAISDALTDAALSSAQSPVVVVPSFGYEAALTGALEKAENGKFVNNIVGGAAVYAIQLKNKSVNNQVSDEEVNSIVNTWRQQQLSRELPALIKDLQINSKKITDNRYKF